MKPTRRSYFQLSLRVAFLVLTAGCIALGILSARVARQRAEVNAILQAGGHVHYQHKFATPSQDYERAPAGIPSWAREFFGDDWFYDVEGVTLYGASCNDETLKHVVALTKLKQLALWPWGRPSSTGPMGGTVEKGPAAGVTDDGLRSLRDHPCLEHISLLGNAVTDAGLKHLTSLPRLKSIQPDRGMSHEAYDDFMASIARRDREH